MMAEAFELSPDEDFLDLSEALDVQAGPPPLRAHQERALAGILGHFQAGDRRVLACGPTGCGKSRLGRAVADGFQSPLCLTHTRPLFLQNSKTICRTVMVQQLVLAAKEGKLAALLARIGSPDLVIQDEAHHLASPGWKLVHELWPEAKLLGLTATPMRGDGKPLRPYYDHLVKIADYSELIEAGVLVSCEIDRPTGVSTRIGRTARQNAAQAYLVHNGLRAIIFCEDTEHSRATVKELRLAGVRAEHIDGDTPDKVRERLFAQFEAGELEVLCNCDVLTEGVDLPCVECVVLAKSYKTRGAYMQAGGRGLRASPSTGKTFLQLVDLVGATIDFNGPDENVEYKLDGAAMDLQPGKVWVCGTCYRNFSPKIVGATKESWVESGGGFSERELGTDDLERRAAWVAKKEAAMADKLSAEFITERQRKTRAKALKDYSKKLALQVGAVVQVCTAAAEGEDGPKITPCPHCLRERPRGNNRADLSRVGRPSMSLPPRGDFTPSHPADVGGALKVLSQLFDDATRRGQCLTTVLPAYKDRVGKELKVGYAKEADRLSSGKYRKYQQEWCDAKIKGGWKPGITFFRVTKFFAKG